MWLTLPPSVILTWPVRKPGDPIEHRGNELWIVTAVFLTAAAVAVSARLYARLFVRKFIGIDDIFVVLGLVCFTRHFLCFEPVPYSALYNVL